MFCIIKTKVKTVCLVNKWKRDAELYLDNIKDFTRIDLSNVERIKLPECVDKKKYVFYDNSSKFSSFNNQFMKIDSIDMDAFIDFPRLKSLFTSFVKADNINLRHLTYLKEYCLMSDLYCNESRPVLKIELPIDIEKLCLLYCNIEAKIATNYQSLNYLELRDGLIILNEAKPFECLKQLKHLIIYQSKFAFQEPFKGPLYIENQSLEELDLHVLNRDGFKIYFDNLPKLKRLRVSNYSIRNAIDLVSFKKLSNLEKLDTSLPETMCYDDPFANFTKLKRLRINGSLYIDKNLFKNLVNLEYLEISGIYSKKFAHYDTFDNLKQLIHLDLTFSYLKKLDFGIFKNLTNLETLNLNRNPLKHIGPGLFVNLNKLKHLQLRDCNLVSIDENAFEGLVSLDELNLDRNNLKEIRVGLFDGLQNLKKIYLGM